MRAAVTLVLTCLWTACHAPDVLLGSRGARNALGVSDEARADASAPQPSEAGASAAGAGGLWVQATNAGTGGVRPLAGQHGVAGSAGSTPEPSPSQGSVGCGRTRAADANSVQLGANIGRYVLDLPASYDGQTPLPLLFALRGAEVSAESFRDYAGLVPVAGDEAIVVHPDALNDASAWDVQRDSPYFQALLAQMLERYCVDPGRVFVFGHAQGGQFASMLACKYGDTIRGASLFAAPAPIPPCVGTPAMLIGQGNVDRQLLVTMGRATRDFFAERNHCDTSIQAMVEPEPCVEYSGCDPTAPVRYCEYDGALGLPSFAADAIWRFFRAL